MSNDSKIREGGHAPEVFVRGGTLSSRESNRISQEEANANFRRQKQDRQRRMSQSKLAPGEIASLRSKQLMSDESPRLVLWYRKYDQYCLSEITMVANESGDGLGPMFTLVCTKCLEMGRPQGQAQLQVRSEHRKFAIDDTTRGKKIIHEGGIPKVVQQCGTVTVEDKVRCGACGWTVRIIDSKVEEV